MNTNSTINNISKFVNAVYAKSYEIPDQFVRQVATEFAIQCFLSFDRDVTSVPKTNEVIEDFVEPKESILVQPQQEEEEDNLLSECHKVVLYNQPKTLILLDKIFNYVEKCIENESCSEDENLSDIQDGLEPEEEKSTRTKTLSISQYGTGLIDPKIIDRELVESNCTSVAFITKELDPDVIVKYFKNNFPISEYKCSFRPDKNYSNHMYIRIVYNDLESADDIRKRIFNGLHGTNEHEAREYVDIWTTYSENAFFEYCKSFITERNLFVYKAHPINDRLISFRFWKWIPKVIIAEFVLPTKEELLQKFTEYKGDRIPVAFYNNVPIKLFKSLKGKLHGFSFKESDNKLDPTKYVNILVFNNEHGKKQPVVTKILKREK